MSRPHTTPRNLNALPRQCAFVASQPGETSTLSREHDGPGISSCSGPSPSPDQFRRDRTREEEIVRDEKLLRNWRTRCPKRLLKPAYRRPYSQIEPMQVLYRFNIRAHSIWGLASLLLSGACSPTCPGGSTRDGALCKATHSASETADEGEKNVGDDLAGGRGPTNLTGGTPGDDKSKPPTGLPAGRAGVVAGAATGVVAGAAAGVVAGAEAVPTAAGAAGTMQPPGATAGATASVDPGQASGGAGVASVGSAGAAGGPQCSPTSAVENCEQKGMDADCDGNVDEGCDCFGTAKEDCNDAGKGVCAAGTRQCNKGAWGACMSTVAPSAEICDGRDVDEDCDGNPNTGCACANGTKQSCTTTRAGPCAAGTQMCSGGQWGDCESTTRPTAAETVCDGKDEDCNGTPDDNAPCPAGQRCYRGACKQWCTDDSCAEKSTNPCRAMRCDQNTGMCVQGTAVATNTPCTTTAISVGYCSNGTCLADTEVVCEVGQFKQSVQWLFNDDYTVCEPGNCQLTPHGVSAFGPCSTRASGQAVVWDVFNDDQNANGTEVSVISARGLTNACGVPGPCAKWFGNPRVKATKTPIQCSIFDDGGANNVGPRDQFTPWYGGKGHPANPDGRADTTVCTPDQCRKWVGNCRVKQ